MTDKQIIIDGVDVSGCSELYNGCCCDNGSFYCKDQPNCQFKLEKRGYKVEQITEFTPREDLIETITHLRVLNAELESYNEQLKESQNIEIKENKILREQLQAKERECDMWKNLAVDNGAVALKYQQQLDQLKAKYNVLKEDFDCAVMNVENLLEHKAKLKAENDELRETIHKDRCTHYVLSECSQEHHSNCVGKNQCIKDLEQENEKLKNERKILDDETLVVEITEQQFEEYQKLKQTLTEIRNVLDTYYDDDWKATREIEKILQKISESEVNNG